MNSESCLLFHAKRSGGSSLLWLWRNTWKGKEAADRAASIRVSKEEGPCWTCPASPVFYFLFYVLRGIISAPRATSLYLPKGRHHSKKKEEEGVEYNSSSISSFSFPLRFLGMATDYLTLWPWLYHQAPPPPPSSPSLIRNDVRTPLSLRRWQHQRQNHAPLDPHPRL